MNRRELIRTGLGSCLLGNVANQAFAADNSVQGLSAPSPAEQPPLRDGEEGLVTLAEAIEKNVLQATWVVTQPHRARLTLKNRTGRRLAVNLESSNVLTHEKLAWLIGGPTKYVGQFGGDLQAGEIDGELHPATIPLLPGRGATIDLPLVSLNQPSAEKFKEIKSPKLTKLKEVLKDPKAVAGLSILSILGSSMTTAQGIAWRLAAGLSWAKLGSSQVEGQAVNQFERMAVDRFLEIQATLAADHPIGKIRETLVRDRLTVLVTGTGPKRVPGVKILENDLPGQRFMGMQIAQIHAAGAVFPKASSLRLEFHVVEQVRKGLFAVEASLASRTGPNGVWLKFSKARVPLTAGMEMAELLQELELQFAPSIAGLTRVSQGPMTSRFRLENHSPMTLAAVEVVTNNDSADAAFYGLADLGIASRGRSTVKIPSSYARAARVRFSDI